MKLPRDMAGAAPVNALDALPEPERFLVGLLRQWYDGPDGPERVAVCLRGRLGAAKARICLRAMEDTFGILLRHARRRLMRHRTDCACVGADEAVFAHFVMVAAKGDREDAMLIASLLVDGALLLPLTEAARQAGLCLCQAAVRDGLLGIPDPPSATRH